MHMMATKTYGFKHYQIILRVHHRQEPLTDNNVLEHRLVCSP